MPKWKIHNKWAKKLGISKEVSIYVSNLIDAIRKGQTLPREYLDFVDKESERVSGSRNKSVAAFIAEITTKHDSGRRKGTGNLAADIQLNFLSSKGEDFIKAWFLHHWMDYYTHDVPKLEGKPMITVKKSLERLETRTSSSYPELEVVKEFIMSNSEEILQDCE